MTRLFITALRLAVPRKRNRRANAVIASQPLSIYRVIPEGSVRNLAGLDVSA